MKLSKLGRITLASVVSLGLGFGVTACGPSNTIDFLYVTSSKNNPGQINVYKVDSQAGRYSIPGSPYSSGGANPVADVASPNGKNLYVVNHDSNTVVEFAIGTNGSVQQQACTIPGSSPPSWRSTRPVPTSMLWRLTSRATAPTIPAPERWWSSPSMPTGSWAPRQPVHAGRERRQRLLSRWAIIR